MDYKGDYFPEEHDERESKIFRVVKTIFKTIFYSVTIFVCGLVLFTVISALKSPILKKNYMTEIPSYEHIDTENMDLKRIYPTEYMSYDGSLEICNVDYTDEYGIIEIGVKYNPKKLTNGERGDCIEYILTDSSGKIYDIGHIETSNWIRYSFARVSFTGLDIDLDANTYKYEGAATLGGSDFTYTLKLYRKSDGEQIGEVVIYSNTTPFSSTDYND